MDLVATQFPSNRNVRFAGSSVGRILPRPRGDSPLAVRITPLFRLTEPSRGRQRRSAVPQGRPLTPRADYGRRKIDATLIENPGSKGVVIVSFGNSTPTGSTWFCSN